MICRYHNHQKTLNLKYIPKSENILINSERSLFSILRMNWIRACTPKAKEEKKNEYTAEEKLINQYKEKELLAKDELEKAELNLELKGRLYDLAMKGNATDEEKKKVWLELLEAQQKYVNTEDEAIKKRKDEITKRGTATFATGEKRQKDYQDLKKESSSKLEGLEQENQISGVPDWMKDQVQLEIDYRKALNEVEVSNHLNKEAQKLEIEEKYAYARLNIEQKMQEQKLEIISNVFASAGSFLAKNTLLYKVMATVQATLDTYLAASLALRSFPPPFGAIAMGTAIASGLANVATIQGIEVPGYATGGFALLVKKDPKL